MNRLFSNGLKGLARSFLGGLLAVLPVVITVAIIAWVAGFVWPDAPADNAAVVSTNLPAPTPPSYDGPTFDANPSSGPLHDALVAAQKAYSNPDPPTGEQLGALEIAQDTYNTAVKAAQDAYNSAVNYSGQSPAEQQLTQAKADDLAAYTTAVQNADAALALAKNHIGDTLDSDIQAAEHEYDVTAGKGATVEETDYVDQFDDEASYFDFVNDPQPLSGSGTNWEK